MLLLILQSFRSCRRFTESRLRSSNPSTISHGFIVIQETWPDTRRTDAAVPELFEAKWPERHFYHQFAEHLGMPVRKAVCPLELARQYPDGSVALPKQSEGEARRMRSRIPVDFRGPYVLDVSPKLIEFDLEDDREERRQVGSLKLPNRGCAWTGAAVLR